jgi:hypothetical protein
MSGTIVQLQRDHGTGTLLGADGKSYMFRRGDVRDVWFHELRTGATVAFEPEKNLTATRVRPCLSGAVS